MALDPWRLRLLAQLHALGTIRAVALAEHVSASNVSQQLAVLEREAHAQLLERTGRRVRLTPVGVILAHRGRELLDHMADVEAEIAGLHSEPAGRIRLAAFPSAMRGLVLPVVQDLRARAPRLAVEVIESEPRESLPAVIRGDVDVAVATDFVDGALAVDPALAFTHLASDPVQLVVPAARPGLLAGSADLTVLREVPWALDVSGSYLDDLVYRLCRRAGFEPVISGRFSSYGVILGAVAADLAVALLPRLATDGPYDVVRRDLAEPTQRTVHAAYRTSARPRAGVRVVLAGLQARARLLAPDGVVTVSA